MRLNHRFCAAVVVLATAACGENAAAPAPTPTPVPTIQVQGPATVYQGGFAQYTATFTGTQGAPVQWSSTDTAVASVDAAGQVRGRAPGAVQISAVAGGLTHFVSVGVLPDPVKPAVSSLALSPAAVSLAGGDATVTITLRGIDGESGVSSARVILSQPGSTGTHPVHRCTAEAPASGTRQDGTWQCSVPLNRHSAPGTWRASAMVTDGAGNISEPHPWTDFAVSGSHADGAAPDLRAFTVQPDSVHVTSQDAQLGIHVRAADAHSGVAAVRVFHRYSTGGSGMIQLAQPATGSVHDGVWSWTPTIPRGTSTRTLSITSVELADFRGNLITFTPERLRELGYSTEVKITS